MKRHHDIDLDMALARLEKTVEECRDLIHSGKRLAYQDQEEWANAVTQWNALVGVLRYDLAQAKGDKRNGVTTLSVVR